MLLASVSTNLICTDETSTTPKKKKNQIEISSAREQITT